MKSGMARSTEKLKLIIDVLVLCPTHAAWGVMVYGKPPPVARTTTLLAKAIGSIYNALSLLAINHCRPDPGWLGGFWHP